MKHLILSLLFVALAGVPAAAQAQLDLPPNDGFFTSNVSIITAEQSAKFERALEDIAESTGQYIVVLFLQDLYGKEPVAVAENVQEEWSLPAHSVLLLISYRDRNATVLPGTAVAENFPPDVVKGIVEKDINPRMRAGEYGLAVLDGVEAIMMHLSGSYTTDRYAPGGVPTSLFIILLYSLVGLFVLSWLIGTIITFTTDYKYSIAGTLLGPIVGVILLEKYGLWLSIPPFIIIGALCDVSVYKFYKACLPKTKKRRRRRRR